MIELLRDLLKSLVVKMNFFAALQVMWIIEFYVLAVKSAKTLLDRVGVSEINEPHIIERFSQLVTNGLETYNEYIYLIGLVLIVVGITGSFFTKIPLLNKDKIVNTYSGFGWFAGNWMVLIAVTYTIYTYMGNLFWSSPIIVYAIFRFVYKMKYRLETIGITFG